ncbi:MAG: hypothetical protein ABWZ82_02395 [Candidatus Limnocylindrales bacterium]
MHPRRSLLVAGLAVSCMVGTAPWTAAQDDGSIEIPGLGETRIDVPRPSSDASACQLDLPEGESIAQRVARLRQLGLFADRASLTDAELAEVIETAIATTWGGAIPPDDPFLELIVAEQDPDRVWWRDLEADVWSGGELYLATLEEWAAISVDAFTPSGISETWASEQGPIRIAFEMGGSTHILEPEYLDDWIDPRILEPINELIAPTGRRFRMLSPFDQTAFVMALTDTEVAELERAGWCFV